MIAVTYMLFFIPKVSKINNYVTTLPLYATKMQKVMAHLQSVASVTDNEGWTQVRLLSA